jgi:hypothetical protein
MARPWDPFVQAYGLRPPRQLEGALLPGRAPQQQLPQQLSAPEPPRLTMEQIRARQVGQPQMAQQQAQPTVGGMPGGDLARLLGTASGAMANLPKNATIGQTLLALGGGLAAGQYGLDQQKRQERVDEARFGQMEQEQAAEAEKNAAREKLYATLPPETQALLKAYPDLAEKMLAPGNQGSKLQTQTINDGDQQRQVLMDMTTGEVVKELGAGPRFAPQRGPLVVNQGGGPGETQYDKDRGGQWAATAGEISAAGQSAQEQLASLGPLMASLANPDVYQGTGGNAITGLKRFGRTMFGMDFEGVGDAEVVQTVGNQMALQMRSMLPGPMSNGDREFLRSLPPNLGNSREGNILIGEFFRRTAERAIERAAAAREYEAEHGRLNAGFDVEWAERMQAEPMFDEDDYAVLQRVAAESPQPSPLAGVPDDITELLGRYGGN